MQWWREGAGVMRNVPQGKAVSPPPASIPVGWPIPVPLMRCAQSPSMCQSAPVPGAPLATPTSPVPSVRHLLVLFWESLDMFGCLWPWQSISLYVLLWRDICWLFRLGTGICKCHQRHSHCLLSWYCIRLCSFFCFVFFKDGNCMSDISHTCDSCSFRSVSLH